MTRVLMLNNEFPPLGGGTATVNQEVLRHLASFSDLEIQLVTGSTERVLRSEGLSPGIIVHRLPLGQKELHHASSLDLLRYAAAAYRFSAKLLQQQKFDAIFAWCTVPAGATARLLSYRFGVPFFVRVSGPDIPGFERRYRTATALLLPLLKHVWRSAAATIVKCEYERREIRRHAPEAQIETIPNGVRFDDSTPRGVARDPFRLVCVARLIERKGQEQLIRAVGILRDRGVRASLRLVGEGDRAEEYRRLIKELRLENYVELAGYIPRASIRKEYEEADAFVLPSENEGMSVSCLEAMAANLPVVVADCPGMAELVQNDVNGLVFPQRDIDALAAAIEQLVSDSALRLRLGNAAATTAKRYGWESAAERYRELLTR